MVVSKKCNATDFPVRWLLGDAGGRGGAVDMYVMKCRMLEYLLTRQLDTFNFPSHVREKMRDALANRTNYRKFLNPCLLYPSDAAAGITRLDLGVRAPIQN